MSWKNGRELATAGNGTHSVSYDYDANGLRTYKIVDGVQHDYIYASGLLLRESYTQNGTSYTLDFVYDQSNRPYFLYLTKTTNGKSTTKLYYYLLNLQGDVVRLIGTDSKTVAAYDYDPFGNLISATGSMAELNPLRYRGYYYDSDTGFYYVSSRYYDPEIGRFINLDGLVSTGQGFLGFNLFAYCNNNPVYYIDPTGNMATEATIVAANWWNLVGWFFAAVVVVEAAALVVAIDKTTSDSNEANDKETIGLEQPEVPDVTYPGNDPTKAPEGTTWRGSGKQGSKQGNYYNPKTGESWHPDLDHPEPIGPHWDYKDSDGIWWRIGENNILVLK